MLLIWSACAAGRIAVLGFDEIRCLSLIKLESPIYYVLVSWSLYKSGVR